MLRRRLRARTAQGQRRAGVAIIVGLIVSPAGVTTDPSSPAFLRPVLLTRSQPGQIWPVARWGLHRRSVVLEGGRAPGLGQRRAKGRARRRRLGSALAIRYALDAKTAVRGVDDAPIGKGYDFFECRVDTKPFQAGKQRRLVQRLRQRVRQRVDRARAGHGLA